jgi:iron complex transport system substrate-binding protein
MSLNMCTDALLLELLPADRIASVTYLSRNPSDSFLWREANRVPINHGNAEEVFAEKPDLVLAGTYSTLEARVVVKEAGIPLLEVPPANDFAAIRAATRAVARALDRVDAAEELIERMDATLRDLDSTKPARAIRVVGWNGSGSVPGPGTLFDAILRAAGGVNIAPGNGESDGSFDLEQLLQAKPDVLAYGSDTISTPSLHTGETLHPLILKKYAGRRISYPSELYGCGLVQSADAAVALRASLLNAMSGGR